MSSKNAVVLGASSGVGRSLAVALAEAGYDLILSASDSRDLDALARDLQLRWGGRYHALALDLADKALDADDFMRRCLERLPSVACLFVVSGLSATEDHDLASDEILARLVAVNYTGPVRLLAAFARYFRQQKSGRLVAFSSIAASVPRGRNLAYSSAKSGLEAYLRALRHLLAGTGVLVQGYALGYVDTAMSFEARLMLPRASPQAVARHVVHHMNCDHGVVYYPRYWRWLIALLRMIPWRIFKRLNF